MRQYVVAVYGVCMDSRTKFPIHVTLELGQVARLDELSERLNIKRSELLREGVDMVLTKYESDELPQEQTR